MQVIITSQKLAEVTPMLDAGRQPKMRRQLLW